MYQLPLTTPNGVCFLIQVSVSSSSIVTQKAAKATLSPACLIYPIPNLVAMTLRLKIYCTVKQLGMLLLYMPPRQLGKLVSSQMKRSPSSLSFFFLGGWGVCNYLSILIPLNLSFSCFFCYLGWHYLLNLHQKSSGLACNLSSEYLKDLNKSKFLYLIRCPDFQSR